MISIMVRTNYMKEFRQQAIYMYETTPEAAIKQIRRSGRLPLRARGVGASVGQRSQSTP